jgi:hypothetical protein
MVYSYMIAGVISHIKIIIIIIIIIIIKLIYLGGV